MPRPLVPPPISKFWLRHSPTTADNNKQEAPLSLRDASCQLKSCQLQRNSAETTCTTTPEQIDGMKLEGYTGPMCNKHVPSTMTRSSHFHCLIGVINKPTMDVLWISPVYRRLAVTKFSQIHNAEIVLVTLTTPTKGTLTHHKTKTLHGRPVYKI